MGLFQTTLLIAGILVLSYLGASFYRANENQTAGVLYNGAIITATGIGGSMIEEIRMRSFDEKTILKTFFSPDSITVPDLLGPDAGEFTIVGFDDVDDFHNYLRLDTVAEYGQFRTRVKVSYTQEMNPAKSSSVRTFNKRVDVFVVNQYLAADTIKLNYIATY